MSTPLRILIGASDGASDYGNKFGEPLIGGFCRSFGLRLSNGERREWIKPIMFSGGIGEIDHEMLKKEEPKEGNLIIKLGGPAFRIGLGGGATSSMTSGSSNLEFDAVQRGDAEMEQRLNLVIRACVEMRGANPILSIHDQGAGGTGNVVKEIIHPAGGVVEIQKVLIGDKTMSVLELWGAEYQENDALLIKESSLEMFSMICEREKCPFRVIGHVTGDGYIRVIDSTVKTDDFPVNLPLNKVLGKLPQKVFEDNSVNLELEPIIISQNILSKKNLLKNIKNVFSLINVGSKRFLTNKVDRSVTGLIAQQQCIGPLHTPLANVQVVAHSILDTKGSATAVGEQPIKGLIDCEIMGRLTVAEALLNLVWVKISKLENIKCSGNWMWPAKFTGEAVNMYSAAKSVSDTLVKLKLAIDGGKDSLSMASKTNILKTVKNTDNIETVKNTDNIETVKNTDNIETVKNTDNIETVKCPGSFVLSVYCDVENINKKIDPCLRLGEGGVLIFIDFGTNTTKLGGTSLAQSWNCVGNEVADVDIDQLSVGFNAIQDLINDGIATAGHDRSDGGLITTLIEMAIASNQGLEIELPSISDNNLTNDDLWSILFCEAPGVVIEISKNNVYSIIKKLNNLGLNKVSIIGYNIKDSNIIIRSDDKILLNETVADLRDMWEETSFALEKLQANPSCVLEEQNGLRYRAAPPYYIKYTPCTISKNYLLTSVKVAILREEGTNGDREAAAAFYLAGFECWDVTVSDLLSSKIDLSRFRGIIFPGGFSFGDVLGSAKGWAATLKYSPIISKQLQEFYNRSDTFSLGICNGCQLMSILGWVPSLSSESLVKFVENTSGRYESRFSSVKIEKNTNSIMLKGMEECTLGVWVAHGEGRAVFSDESLADKLASDGQIGLRYVDDENKPTMVYPFNPNGSEKAVAGLTSLCGRHLALMPHPERTCQTWNMPWIPQEWQKNKISPWMKMFNNAREWCGE
eukprot:GHVL01005683.1.p1 GENE.GHVL01005683.1~~GHVL01005683.1.p1  ORF type:complete len:975 (+),score=276.69 GHVL01005683.1:1107-4031(+)